jgi:hypothetical protein
MATVPLATAVLAVAYAPPATVEIAGVPVTVTPVLGQANSRVFGGALVRPQYARLPLLDKAVGVDVDANVNLLVPSDKETRSYLTSLWENPEPAIGLIKDTARRHVLVWAAAGFAAGLALDGAVLFLRMGRRARLARYPTEQAELIDAYNRPLRRAVIGAGVAAVLVLDIAASRTYTHEDDHPIVRSAALDGTALEGTQVTGLLADALPFTSVLRPRTEFYDKVSRNLETALAEQSSLTTQDGEVSFVLAEDFEDVNGMARQVGLSARLIDANFIALTGDLTFAGRREETYLLDTIDYYSDKKPVWFAPGLHDTTTIVDAAISRGWHVADGTTHDVDGLTLLAAADPRISTVGDFGVGTVRRDPDVDVDTFVQDIAEASCATSTDFILLHDHLLGERVAVTGCQTVAVLDGRSYRFLGLWHLTTVTGRPTLEFTIGSAGGHVDTRPNAGVIKHPARFAILYVVAATKETSFSLVTVRPDATVSITPRALLGDAGGMSTTPARTGGRTARDRMLDGVPDRPPGK